MKETSPLQNALLVVKSVHHGNTAMIARTMAVVLGAEVSSPEATPYKTLAGCGLVGFGSGVYYGRLHPALFDWLRGLPDTPEASRPAFIFSTSGLPFLAKFWHWPLRQLVARKGFSIVGEFTCRGFDTWGPLWLAGGLNKKHPDERDLQRAREFARTLARSRQLLQQASGEACDEKQLEHVFPGSHSWLPEPCSGSRSRSR
jgi:flavodoxin